MEKIFYYVVMSMNVIITTLQIHIMKRIDRLEDIILKHITEDCNDRKS